MNTARELADTLAALLHREHDALAEFLVALAKFNERRALKRRASRLRRPRLARSTSSR